MVTIHEIYMNIPNDNVQCRPDMAQKSIEIRCVRADR